MEDEEEAVVVVVPGVAGEVAAEVVPEAGVEAGDKSRIRLQSRNISEHCHPNTKTVTFMLLWVQHGDIHICRVSRCRSQHLFKKNEMRKLAVD